MNKNNKFSIGEFSEKTGISIPTLHYYDEIGLLRPEKKPFSGHRIYNYQDIITLQKILSLKFLGYSLDKIANLLYESSFTVELNEALSLHLQALEKEKESIEQSMNAIKRVTKLLEGVEEVDSAILFSLIHGIQMENIHKEWIEQPMLTEVVEGLSKKTDEEKAVLDQTFIQFAKEVKQHYGKPVENLKVQEMIKSYLEASFMFFGDDLMKKLAEVDVKKLDIQDFEDMTPSPFTEDEQNWLNQAMEYYMKQTELE